MQTHESSFYSDWLIFANEYMLQEHLMNLCAANAIIIHVAKPSALKKVVVHLFDGAHRIVPPNSSDNRLELLRGQGVAVDA